MLELFLGDLRAAAEEVWGKRTRKGKTAMYGMAATFPDRELVKEAF